MYIRLNLNTNFAIIRMGDHLRYSMVLRSADNLTMIEGSASPNQSSYTKEANKIKEKMLGSGLAPNERKKVISNKHGAWICECDGNQLIYVCLIAEGYPDRLGYQFILECRNKASDIPNYYGCTPSQFASAFQQTFDELNKKYNDPASFDKLSAVNSKVEVATKKTEEALRKALENQQDLNNLNAKTENLKNLGKEFNDHADELRQIMYWRNVKLKMILSMMGVAALFSVAMPVIQTFT